MKKHYCKDCKEEIKELTSIRCRKCYVLFARNENAANHRHGKCCKNKHYFCECGKELSGYRAKFCRSCTIKGERHHFFGKQRPDFAKKISGKNHPAFIPELDRNYPIEFNNKLKEQIRKRDNYKCQLCFINEKLHIMINKQELHIHHVDYNKQNCSEDNLITLCIKCNTKVNFNRDYWYAYFTYIIINFIRSLK